jgi:hypothetical protein
LVEDEEGLNRADLPSLIPDQEIAIAEFRANRILDDLVVSAVLPQMSESVTPGLT